MTDIDEDHRQADALYEAGRYEEALAAFRRLSAASPQSLPLRFNLGNTLMKLRRFAEAVAAYDSLLATEPAFAMARHNKAVSLLHMGDLAGGFREYEWRRAAPGFIDDDRYRLPRPWQGQDLRGKTLYIFCELFQGDLMQFGRYALLVEMVLGAKVILSAPEPMHALLRTMSPTIRLVPEDAPPPAYDFQCAMMSLPMMCGTSLTAIPKLPAYLRAEPARVARWRARIGEEGFRIGIAWQGSERAAIRSFPLAVAAARLAHIPGARLISLQKGLGLDQLAALPPGQVEGLGDDFDPGPDLFLDTAAAMTCCDLLIVPDTSVVHLAAALGLRTWLATPWAADWRWLGERSDSPWYPSLRLFRQPALGDWAAVFDQMAAAIRTEVKC